MKEKILDSIKTLEETREYVKTQFEQEIGRLDELIARQKSKYYELMNPQLPYEQETTIGG